MRNPNAPEYVDALHSREFSGAHAEIRTWPGYRPTPLYQLKGLATEAGVANIWYKDEASRFGLGSFKALGGAYAVLRCIQAETGAMTFTTATDGNHGRAVAWGARMFGAQSVIFLPASCSANREAAIAAHGARIVRTGLNYDDAVRECVRAADRNGWRMVSDTSWNGYVDVPRIVMQGYTLLVDEVLAQLSVDLTHIFVQAGVGGLAAAVCAYLWQQLGNRRPRFIVVEPEGACCVMASALAGTPTKAPRARSEPSWLGWSAEKYRLLPGKSFVPASTRS